MYQLCPGKPHTKPNVRVNGKVLNIVDNFTYLDSTLSQHATISQEVKSRVAKASSAFGRLQQNVWACRVISLKTKLKVYQAVVVTILLLHVNHGLFTEDTQGS